MPLFGICRASTFALLISAVAGCQSTPAPNCSGWTKNDLTPAGTVALIQADRAGAERVIGNDRNGERLGCWE